MSSTGSGASLLQRALVHLVDASRRHAWTVVLAGILLAVGSGLYASHHLGVNTDTDQMFSASLPWRQRAMALDRAFPQFQGLLVAVIDANVPEASLRCRPRGSATGAWPAIQAAATEAAFVSLVSRQATSAQART